MAATFPRVVPSRLLLGVVLLAGTASCGHRPVVGVSALFAEARTNEVAAYARNKGETMYVRGVVSDTGLSDEERVVARASYLGPYGGTATARRQIVYYPYVYLADTRRPTQDLVLCYFSPSQTSRVGQLSKGARITVSGRFQEYFHGDDGLEVILKSCKVEE